MIYMFLSNNPSSGDINSSNLSCFIWDSRKLPFPSHLGKYFITTGKISAIIHEIGKINISFGLGMTPI